MASLVNEQVQKSHSPRSGVGALFFKSLSDAAMSNVTVHANLIQDVLREATEKIKAGMDLEKAKGVIQERLGMQAIEGIDLQEMQAVVHEGQVAFRCRMIVRSDIAMIIDCHGNCMTVFPEKDDPHVSPEQRINRLKKPLILIEAFVRLFGKLEG
jgi:hypothetical protein